MPVGGGGGGGGGGGVKTQFSLSTINQIGPTCGVHEFYAVPNDVFL